MGLLPKDPRTSKKGLGTVVLWKHDVRVSSSHTSHFCRISAPKVAQSRDGSLRAQGASASSFEQHGFPCSRFTNGRRNRTGHYICSRGLVLGTQSIQGVATAL